MNEANLEDGQTVELDYDLYGLKTPAYHHFRVDSEKSWRLTFTMKTDEQIVKNVWGPKRPGLRQTREKIVMEKPMCVRVMYIPSTRGTVMVCNADEKAHHEVRRSRSSAKPEQVVRLRRGTDNFMLRLDLSVPNQGKGKGKLFILPEIVTE